MAENKGFGICKDFTQKTNPWVRKKKCTNREKEEKSVLVDEVVGEF